MWITDGKKLRDLRISRQLTLVALAKRSGVAERTLRTYEAGRRGVKRELLAAVATALEAPITAFARDEQIPSAVTRTKLQQLVRAEAKGKRKRGAGEIDALVLQNLHTSPDVYRDERHWVSGTVDCQDALTDSEERALGIKRGIGARFNIVKEVARGAALSVTVFTTKAEATREMQSRMHRTVTIDVKVVVVETADGLAGFACFATTRLVPLALVVEEFRRRRKPVGPADP